MMSTKLAARIMNSSWIQIRLVARQSSLDGCGYAVVIMVVIACLFSTLCTNCGFILAEECTQDNAPYDAVIASLTASERQKLQKESNTIVYPILSRSLPTDLPPMAPNCHLYAGAMAGSTFH